MIKQTISLFALLLPLSMQAQQHKLSAQIAGLGQDITVFLTIVDNPNKAETLDSAKVAADGSFSLRYASAEATDVQRNVLEGWQDQKL
jgi:hypothetical protein